MEELAAPAAKESYRNSLSAFKTATGKVLNSGLSHVAKAGTAAQERWKAARLAQGLKTFEATQA